MCVEDKLEESDTQCSGVREVNNEARLSHKGPFVRILTGQRCELKSRSANDLCGVNLNAMILIDRTPFHIYKTKKSTLCVSCLMFSLCNFFLSKNKKTHYRF